MSTAKGVFFNGKLITLPGAYSMMESTMTASRAGAGAKVVALVGECTGGQPGAIQLFSEPTVAKKVLKSGDLLKAAQKAWNPVTATKDGVSLGGAFTIACIRTNKATKGITKVTQTRTLPAQVGEVVASISALSADAALTCTGTYNGTENATLKVYVTKDSYEAGGPKFNWCYASEELPRFSSDKELVADTPMDLAHGLKIEFADGTYNVNDTWLIPCTAPVTVVDPVFTIQSKDWGKDANAIQHKLSAGTERGTKKLVIYNSITDSYETYDNLGATFEICYRGDQPYAAMSIVADGRGNSIKLQTYIGADEASSIVDLDINLDTKTFKNIKALTTYLSGFENYEVNMYRAYNPELTVNDLDFMSRVDIKAPTDPRYLPVPVTAVLPDLKKIVTMQSQLCEVTVINRELSNYADYDYVSLVGGSEGISPASWVEFFDTLAGFNVTYIVPLTDDLSIMAECREHVLHMSENMGKERRMLCGQGNHLTVEAAIANAQRIASDRVQYIYPGFYDPNDKGEIELYPAYILAAQCAGRAAFLPDGEAITHDHFRFTAIEKELEPDEITRLLNAGIVTFEFVMSEDIYQSGSVRMVQDITTFTDSNDPLYVERAIGITADFINKDMRRALEKLLVGKRTTSATLTTARNTILSILKERVKNEIIVAYKDVNVYKQNGAVWVDYAAAPAEPTNFVLISSHFYSEDISASESNTTTFSGRGITDMSTVV